MTAPYLDDPPERLPLPLTQLCRRARNARNSLEQHLAAYYLWEAALKLLGAVAVVEYADLGDADPDLAVLRDRDDYPAFRTGLRPKR
jgi:hypothetical protein